MPSTQPRHMGDHLVNNDNAAPIERPTPGDPISPERFELDYHDASSVAESEGSSSHDQPEMDEIMQGLRAAKADANAKIEELKLQMVKRKLLTSGQSSAVSNNSHGQNVNHAGKYLRAYQSPNVANTMAREQPVDPDGPCAAEQAPLTTANLSKHAGVPFFQGPLHKARPQVFAISSPPTKVPHSGPSAADTPGMAAQRLSIEQAAAALAEERRAVTRAEERIAQQESEADKVVTRAEERVAYQAAKVDKDFQGKRHELIILEQRLRSSQEANDNKTQLAHEELSAAMRANKDRDTVQRLQLKEEADAEYRSTISLLEMRQNSEANALRVSLEQEAMSSIRQQVQAAKEAQDQQQAEAMRRARAEVQERDQQLAMLQAAAIVNEQRLASMQAAAAAGDKALQDARARALAAETAQAAAAPRPQAPAPAEAVDNKASAEIATLNQSVMAALGALSSAQDGKVNDILLLISKLAEKVDSHIAAQKAPSNAITEPPPKSPPRTNPLWRPSALCPRPRMVR